jgi:integrase
MAYIEKRPNGTYRAHVFVGTDETGKKIKQYVTRPTRRECKVAADEMERRIREGAVSSSNIRTLPLSVYADRWFEANRSRLAPSTRKAYRMYIDLHITPTPIGPKRLCDITETDIMEWLAANTKNAACTIRKHFFLLQDIMGAALKGANPCIGVKPPKAEDYIPVVPTREEFKALHDAVRGTKDELPILLIAKCGMRPGEIFALEWADIDFDRQMIRVDEALSIDEEGGKYVEKDPKSRKGKREVAAPADVMQLLKDKRANARVIGIRILSIRPDSFTKRYSKILDKLVAAEKVREMRLYDLRHYHATEMYRLGIPDQYAAGRLGHDVWVLKKIYQHLHLDDTQAMDDRIRKLLDGDGETPKKKPRKPKTS